MNIDAKILNTIIENQIQKIYEKMKAHGFFWILIMYLFSAALPFPSLVRALGGWPLARHPCVHSLPQLDLVSRKHQQEIWGLKERGWDIYSPGFSHLLFGLFLSSDCFSLPKTTAPVGWSSLLLYNSLNSGTHSFSLLLQLIGDNGFPL